MCNFMLGHEIGGGIDAWMGPPATGVGLVMGVAHQFPGLAKPCQCGPWQVSAGAPVNPLRAKNPAVMPVGAPQPTRHAP